MTEVRRFIIVDDDPINNTLCGLTIKRAVENAQTRVFTEPEEALAFIMQEYSKGTEPAILLLDVNMPSMTGWEFIEQFEKFGMEIKSRIRIYMLTSSVNLSDRAKAESYPSVNGFISKPLMPGMIHSISSGS